MDWGVPALAFLRGLPTAITKVDSKLRSLARIHRWTRTEGVRTLEGGVRKLQTAMARARIRVKGGLAAVCRRFWGRRCRPTVVVASEMHRDKTQQEMLAVLELVRVCGDVQLAGWRVSGGRAPSGGERQRSESSEGATELGFPWPTLGQMQSEAARRAGEPSGHGKEAASQGLGGHDLLAQTDARRPAKPGCGRSPAPPARRRWRGSVRRGEMVQPHAVLEVSEWRSSISAWRRWSASSSRVSPSRSVMKA